MKQKKPDSENPTVLSLFTCGMGMDLGFEKAKFDTVYTNDIETFACNTIRHNRSKIPCDEGDITDISSKEILKKSGYKNIIVQTRHQLDLRDQKKVMNFFKKNSFQFVIIAAAKVGGIYANDTYKADFIYENLVIQNNII